MKDAKKFGRINIIHIAVLTAVYTLTVLLIMRFEYAYGSKIDWGDSITLFPIISGSFSMIPEIYFQALRQISEQEKIFIISPITVFIRL